MTNAFDILRERGFVRQMAAPARGEGAETARPAEELLRELLASPPVTFYVGFDATADSLHVGSLTPIMAMAHLQRAGHRPIAIIGGGTTMVGDPSGKTELRRIMTPEEIDRNGRGILSQLQRYLDLGGDNGRFLNNAEWLLPLRYVDFLREIGRHFRVNEMIKSEAYRQRLEREEGLSFIEFNYQLLQAYDFLQLFEKHGCRLQLGGDDQWGNIVAGIELIRRVTRKNGYGLTFPLLQTARGEKMGKTAGGAVWLSAERTSPYDFYQYWINTDDRDVKRFLKFFTFVPVEQAEEMTAGGGAALNAAKEVLAFEATKLCHGEEEANRARAGAKAAFSGGGADGDSELIPTAALGRARLSSGVPLADLLVEIGLQASKSAARRLIQQGGAYVNSKQVEAVDARLTDADVTNGVILVRCGKKQVRRVVVE